MIAAKLKAENKRLRELLKNLAEGPLQAAINFPGATQNARDELIARRDNAFAAAEGKKFTTEAPVIQHPGHIAISVDADRLSNILCGRMYSLMDDGIANNDCADACLEAITALKIKGLIGRRASAVTLLLDYSAWQSA